MQAIALSGGLTVRARHLIQVFASAVFLAVFCAGCSPTPSDDFVRARISSQYQKTTEQRVSKIFVISRSVPSEHANDPALEAQPMCAELVNQMRDTPAPSQRTAYSALQGLLVSSGAAKLVDAKAKAQERVNRTRVIDEQATALNAERRKNCRGLFCGMGASTAYRTEETREFLGYTSICSFEVNPTFFSNLAGNVSVQVAAKTNATDEAIVVKRTLSTVEEIDYKVSDMGEQMGMKYRYVDYSVRTKSWPLELDAYVQSKGASASSKESGRLTLMFDSADKTWH